MDMVAKCLSTFSRKANLLERRIKQSLTHKQLFEVAQEAANSYHVLVIQLMAKEQTGREQLTSLSQKFSRIENEAIRKFYGAESVGPTRTIL